MTTEYKIEKGIPIAPKSKYPFDNMEIGDSCFFDSRSIPNIHNAYSRLKPKKFTTKAREENGVKGIRIWRIA